MSESDLPSADLSPRSPPRRLKCCKPPPAHLYTIIEVDEDHLDSGVAPVSIYEDLSNYESPQDGIYDLGVLPPHHSDSDLY